MKCNNKCKSNKCKPKKPCGCYVKDQYKEEQYDGGCYEEPCYEQTYYEEPIEQGYPDCGCKEDKEYDYCWEEIRCPQDCCGGPWDYKCEHCYKLTITEYPKKHDCCDPCHDECGKCKKIEKCYKWVEDKCPKKHDCCDGPWDKCKEEKCYKWVEIKCPDKCEPKCHDGYDKPEVWYED